MQLASMTAHASQTVLFSELDEAMQQWQSDFQQDKASSEFELFKQQHLQAFDKYVEQHFAELDAFRDQLIAKWGEAKVTDNARYVDYNAANDARLVVDFENNRLSISVRHEELHTPSTEQAREAFEVFLSENRALLDAFFQGREQHLDPTELSSTHRYNLDNAKKAQSLLVARQQIEQQTKQQQQLIERQLDNKLALTTSASDTHKAQTLLNEKKQQLEQLQTKRVRRLKNSIKAIAAAPQSQSQVSEFSISLPKSNNFPQRAKAYTKQIVDNSQRFDIASSLVFSVMHTESHFNPLAKSAIPAFGLMQVVPTSAGVDVNRFLYNLDEPMTGPYLFVADNNIEAGAAYLHILDKRYLRHIIDPLSRKYCMIAAYNTGAGNVARVFNSDNSRNIKKASRIINSMTPELVLAALEQGLPYDETKHYLQRVLEREHLYQTI